MTSPRNLAALRLFKPLAGDYGRWSRILSFGQDPLWRRRMVETLDLPPGAKILDVAAGTGEVTRLLAARGHAVVSLDQSPQMLAEAVARGARAVLARAEDLPFPDGVFDGLTFTYLLRYVDDPLATMRELARVVKPGGGIGMVEFGRPSGVWGPLWHAYTRIGLPLAGALIAPGWKDVGSFLGPSIDDFHRRYPGDALELLWREAGIERIKAARMSLGGGLVMTGVRR